MAKKIVLIRGTSGSGKTTAAREFLNRYPHEEVLDGNGKVAAYKIDAGLKHPVYLIGKYSNVCGGLDGVQTQLEAGNRAVYFSNKMNGHVIGEGLLQSAAGPAGALTKAVYENGNAVFGIMDTPLEVCIERVKARRLARGDEREFNPKNTNDKWTQTMSTAKTLAGLGYDVRPIRHTSAFEDVLAIFKEAESE